LKRAETDLASFSKLSAPSCLTLSHPSFFLLLCLFTSFSIWSFAGIPPREISFRSPLSSSWPCQRSLLLSFMHYRRSSPLFRSYRRSSEVVLVHSYFGTNIMLISIAMHPSRADVCPHGRTKHRCCMPMVIDKDRETVTRMPVAYAFVNNFGANGRRRRHFSFPTSRGGTWQLPLVASRLLCTTEWRFGRCVFEGYRFQRWYR